MKINLAKVLITNCFSRDVPIEVNQKSNLYLQVQKFLLTKT